MARTTSKKISYTANVHIQSPDIRRMDSHRYRNLNITIRIKPEGDGGYLSENCTEYLVQAWVTRYSEDREWQPTYYERPEITTISNSIDLRTAERAVKSLKKLYTYTDTLPIQPDSMADWVRVIFALHGVVDVEYSTSTDYEKQWASVPHMCYLIEEAYKALRPEPEPEQETTLVGNDTN